MRIQSVGLILLFVFASSCSDIEKVGKSESLFTLMSADETGIDFINNVENQKNFNIFKYRNFYNGGGVAIGDINNDGLPDIYMTANMLPNKLYLNKGDFQFEDISETAGIKGNKPWSTGVLMVDINNDGLLDIYVSNAGNLTGDNHDNELFINNGDLTFSEKANEYNLAKTGFSTHASFFDYDKDGDLDAYILNNSNIPVSSLGYAAHRQVRARDWDVPEVFKGVGDLLLRNDNGVFKDVSDEAGVYGSLIGFGLGVYVTDINRDTYPDIYVSNDFYERDYLYINNQDGTFTEDIKNWVSHLCLSAMGVDMGDINNDGLNDIFITDMLPEENQRIKSVMEFENYNIFKLKQSKDFYQQYIQNTLQINNGNGSFSEIAYYSGVAKTDWSWAGLMFDMDNDRYKDLYVTNGIPHDLTDIDFVDFFADEVIQNLVLTGKKEEISDIIEKMPVRPLSNYAYKNQRDLTFKNVANEWGLEIPSFSNGAAYADLDNDGDQDIVVNNVNMEAFIYRNNSESINENNFLRVKLIGSENNTFAIGTEIEIYIENEVLFQEQMPFRGFQSSIDYTMNIGLGGKNTIDSILVRWPDATVTILKDVKANQTIEIDQETGNEYKFKINEKSQLLKEVENTGMISHRENYFNDFDFETLIPQQLSQEGPATAVGDLNGDSIEDVFVGGAKGQSGMVYLHSGEGKMIHTEQEEMINDHYFEDTAASIFDVDNDGDQDILVGSGGNEVEDKSDYGLRLYLNDGNGNFKKSVNEFPSLGTNISVLAPHDFDNDGDLDVFVGSRSVPAVYGINPSHFLFVNDGNGVFNDGTERYAYDIKEAGMITDAIWTDLDDDNKMELITVSDWGSPKVFRLNGKFLKPIESSLDSLHGWWLTISSSDLDNDGDMDLILGNKGSNIPYKPSFDSPMKLWVNDFDENGGMEQITTVYENNGDYPLHMRKEVTMQIVSLKKENLKASAYAKKTIQELFPKEVVDRTLVKKSTISESIVAENLGNGQFRIKVLPNRVQLSCVCDITCKDINNDGIMDLIMAGNNYEFRPQYSRLDASYGHVLIGNGNLDFEWKNYGESGFFVKDEVKHLELLKDKDGSEYLFTAINDSLPKVFQFN